MGTLWREFVQSKDDAIAFMEIMYPQFPKQVQLAYVDMFERAIAGDIQLDPQLLYSKADVERNEQTWDPIKEIEEERTKGLINLTTKRLEDLISNE